jgi:hypothetical protein
MCAGMSSTKYRIAGGAGAGANHMVAVLPLQRKTVRGMERDMGHTRKQFNPQIKNLASPDKRTKIFKVHKRLYMIGRFLKSIRDIRWEHLKHHKSSWQ